MMSNANAQACLERLRASWFGRNLALSLTLAALVSAIVTYAVITGSSTPLAPKPKRVLVLLFVNLALLTLLIGVVGNRVYGLWAALRIGSAGSKLQKRIVLMFSLVTILPTMIVSVFSALFFNLGIQAWFNDKVNMALGESLAVARAYLEEHKENLRADAIAMAGDLSRVANLAATDPADFNRVVATQSALRVLTEVIVFQRNRIIAQGRLSFALAFERIPQDVLERAAGGEVVLMTTDDDKVRALTRIEGLPDTFLLVGRLVDSRVIDHMENTQGAVQEYQGLREQITRLESMFSAVFITLALLLLLAAVWYGMIFAARLTKPVSNLVVAAGRVRGGDYSARVEAEESNDEIGTLSRAFNRMTEQLETQRRELIEANRRLDERRRFSEAVLSGVSAGVIALDRDKRITLFNRSAATILAKIEKDIAPGNGIHELLPGIQEQLMEAERHPGEQVQTTLAIDHGVRSLTLHVRISVEQLADQIEGFIVTFDDISVLVAAQRNAAWADVARRVAHEIRNPLTPIQLAAERIRKKYVKYMEGEEAEAFLKYTDTIVRHVADIGRMVDEFVSFARMPNPVFKDENLGDLIKKSIFSASCAHPAIEHRLHVPDVPLMLRCDERQISQVMTNILKNAGEAIEARIARQREEGMPVSPGIVSVTLQCVENEACILVEDNGIGFPPDQIQKMLEPYMTTRSKGTGLGLAIVKKIIDDHNGLINIDNMPGGGARITLSFLQQCDINGAA